MWTTIATLAEKLSRRYSGRLSLQRSHPTPDGTAVRDYIRVSDLASAQVLSLCKLLKGTPGHALNLGIAREFSVFEIVNADECVSGQRPQRISAQRRAGNLPILIADSATPIAALGWKPARSAVDDIISDALNWE